MKKKLKFPKIQLPKFKMPKFDLRKITPFHVVCLLASIVVVLVGILSYLLLVPDDGVPDITIPPTTVTVPTEGTTGATEENTTGSTTEPTETVRPMLPKMEQLYAQNSDLVGWIYIPDTKVDYPVMYTPYDPEKYIHANFKEQYSLGGLPFIDANCSLDPESDNLIFYAHNMNNGTMFENITYYAYKNFWKEHPYIYFTTLYEERVYEVVAAFHDKVYSPTDDVFKFYQFIDAKDEADFENAMKHYKAKAEYDTGVTAEYGDRLITLVTCSYHIDDGRFVVVAKEITPEVQETVPAETTN